MEQLLFDLLLKTLNPHTVNQAEIQLKTFNNISTQLFTIADNQQLDMNIRLAAIIQLKYQKDQQVIKDSILTAISRQLTSKVIVKQYLQLCSSQSIYKDIYTQALFHINNSSDFQILCASLLSIKTIIRKVQPQKIMEVLQQLIHKCLQMKNDYTITIITFSLHIVQKYQYELCSIWNQLLKNCIYLQDKSILIVNVKNKEIMFQKVKSMILIGTLIIIKLLQTAIFQHKRIVRIYYDKKLFSQDLLQYFYNYLNSQNCIDQKAIYFMIKCLKQVENEEFFYLGVRYLQYDNETVKLYQEDKNSFLLFLLGQEYLFYYPRNAAINLVQKYVLVYQDKLLNNLNNFYSFNPVQQEALLLALQDIPYDYIPLLDNSLHSLVKLRLCFKVNMDQSNNDQTLSFLENCFFSYDLPLVHYSSLAYVRRLKQFNQDVLNILRELSLIDDQATLEPLKLFVSKFPQESYNYTQSDPRLFDILIENDIYLNENVLRYKLEHINSDNFLEIVDFLGVLLKKGTVQNIFQQASKQICEMLYESHQDSQIDNFGECFQFLVQFVQKIDFDKNQLEMVLLVIESVYNYNDSESDRDNILATILLKILLNQQQNCTQYSQKIQSLLYINIKSDRTPLFTFLSCQCYLLKQFQINKIVEQIDQYYSQYNMFQDYRYGKKSIEQCLFSQQLQAFEEYLDYFE